MTIYGKHFEVCFRLYRIGLPQVKRLGLILLLWFFRAELTKVVGLNHGHAMNFSKQLIVNNLVPLCDLNITVPRKFQDVKC